ncbi:MAG: hypothetical protein QOH37_3357 [Nocardioidaceae bacterium]|nr:hypothetical protein [Nocardioidaceae bacterium]
MTWWGHSALSIGFGDRVVATDPLLTRRVWHLRRSTPVPAPESARADVVLVSHLHRDHLHLPSLDRFDRAVPVVVPRGAARLVRGLARRHLVEVSPGDTLELAGVSIAVLPAEHDGRRSVLERPGASAIGFRLEHPTASVWYPGDTGPGLDVAGVAPVDLAVVPIGGWGPSLGDDHLDPAQAATLVERVGARWALAVHYGTFWPLTQRRAQRHHHFFVTPPERFRDALADSPTEALTPPHGERLDLVQRTRWTRPSSQTGSSDS